MGSGRAETYFEIRRRVLDWGTRPLNGDPARHADNKALARGTLESLCRPFDPRTPPEVFWRAAWTAFRRIGHDSETAAQDIAAHEASGVFASYATFVGAPWNFPKRATAKSGWGADARAYLDAAPPFDDDGMIRNAGMLKKSIQVARALDEAVTAHGARYLDGMFGAGFLDGAQGDMATGQDMSMALGWLDHYLGLISGDSDEAGLHMMMDLGLPLAAPDPRVTEMLLKLGWLDGFGAPKGLASDDIPEKYTQRGVYKATLRSVHALAAEMDPNHPNAIREIFWVLSSYFGPPKPKDGIARTLHAELPITGLR